VPDAAWGGVGGARWGGLGRLYRMMALSVTHRVAAQLPSVPQHRKCTKPTRTTIPQV
jgi:hypothetical protein